MQANYWAVITGAGTGIGAALAHNLCKKGLKVLAIGRRLQKLEEMRNACAEEYRSHIKILGADIASVEDRKKIFKAIPDEETNGADEQRNLILFLIQNAAIGDPGRLLDIKGDHFEYAMNVNVTAPLLLTQGFITRMMETAKLQGLDGHWSCGPRILHLGTSVAFRPQLGTATYGITKMAFHRLYLQLKEELKCDFPGVVVGSASPGVVDTEGVQEHIVLASREKLPHVAFFEQVMANNSMLDVRDSADQLVHLLVNTTAEDFSAKEWTQSEMYGIMSKGT